MNCSLRPVGPAQRAPLERITAATGLFRPAEVATAVELLDECLAGDPDYRFVGAYDHEELAGYACWGPTPGTQGTADLYWIVVDPARQRQGVGTALWTAVETELVGGAYRLVVVETSARPDYAPTRAFYARHGFREVATIPDYYAPGDALTIYLKDLRRGVLARTPA